MMYEKFREKYSPSYFLASLGNGGLAVVFFMYLMFMIKHPNSPIPVFEDIMNVFTGNDTFIKGITGIALLGIIYFAYRHVKLLIMNMKEFKKFKQSDEYDKIKGTNAEVSMMAVPLTYAMTVNVSFIIGAVFIPNLWNYVEFLFPVAIIAFGLIGIYAVRIFLVYLSSLVITGKFDFEKNNNLSQLISSFAFIMVGVGFAASGAMSHITLTYMIGLLGAIFFTSLSVVFLGINLVLGFKSILRSGITEEGAPSIWIIIPIITLLGITFVRVTSGVYHNILNSNPSPVLMFIVLSVLVSIQIIFGITGYMILKKIGYFNKFISGTSKSVGSYSLVCPGVALFVLGMFLIHWGFVKTGIVNQFSVTYIIMVTPLILLQYKTINTLSKLNFKLLEKEKPYKVNVNVSN